MPRSDPCVCLYLLEIVACVHWYLLDRLHTPPTFVRFNPFPPTSCVFQDEQYSLALAATGFMRGALFPVDNSLTECPPSGLRANTCFGGCHRRRAYVAQVRANNTNTLVVDSGSSFWGSLFYTVFNTSTTVECMNRTGYDVVGLGPSDFLSDEATLNEWMDSLPATLPIISSNVNVSSHPLFSSPRRNGGLPKLLPHVVLERSGVLIGVLAYLNEGFVATASRIDPRVEVSRAASIANSLRRSIAAVKRSHPRCSIFVLIVDDYWPETMRVRPHAEARVVCRWRTCGWFATRA